MTGPARHPAAPQRPAAPPHAARYLARRVLPVLALGVAILGALYLWHRWGMLVALDSMTGYCL